MSMWDWSSTAPQVAKSGACTGPASAVGKRRVVLGHGFEAQQKDVDSGSKGCLQVKTSPQKSEPNSRKSLGFEMTKCLFEGYLLAKKWVSFKE